MSAEAETTTDESLDSYEMTATDARRLALAKLLAEELDLEKDVVFFPSEEDAKWVNGGAIVLTPEVFDGENMRRREVWMYELFTHLVAEDNDHISKFKNELEEGKETFYELMAEIGRNSIDSELDKRGFSPDRFREE